MHSGSGDPSDGPFRAQASPSVCLPEPSAAEPRRVGGKNGAHASVPEVRQLLEVVLRWERWSATVAIAWYVNRQRRKAAAGASHTRRWLREHP